jgi:hypothetical protein
VPLAHCPNRCEAGAGQRDLHGFTLARDLWLSAVQVWVGLPDPVLCLLVLTDLPLMQAELALGAYPEV